MLVDNDGQMCATVLQQLQHFPQRRSVGNENRLVNDLLDLKFLRLEEKRHDVLAVQDTYDVIKVFSVNRQSGISRDLKLMDHLGKTCAQLYRHDFCPGKHNL